MNKRKIIIGVTGASGAVYAKVLFEKIKKVQMNFDAVAVVMSDNSKIVWKHELSDESFSDYPFTFYDKNDFNAPFASGSAQYDTMIICPCSMGTMGRIAMGVSDGLITRAADVILKERRKLVLITRETPFSLIHINNMKTITEAGGIICPACPSFYSNPSDFSQLAATVIDRVLDLCDIKTDAYRWKS